MRKLAVLALSAALVMGTMTGCGSTNSDAKNSDNAGTNKSASAEAGFDTSKDISVVSREDGSGTRGAFIELFGIEEKKDGEKVDMTTDDAQITNSTSVMLTTVAGDDYAIGYVSLDVLDDSVNALNLDDVAPTSDNIVAGTYFLCRPFVMATKGEISGQNELVQAFFDFLKSDEGKAVVKAVGLITVD